MERSAQPREHEFLLFSDCLIWLVREETEHGRKSEWGNSEGGWSGEHGINDNSGDGPGSRPVIARSRSENEAELMMLRVHAASDISLPSTPSLPLPARNPHHHPMSDMMKHHVTNTNAGAAGGEERWVYQGRAELVDVEVIVSPPMSVSEETSFEVLSSKGSFVLYAGEYVAIIICG